MKELYPNNDLPLIQEKINKTKKFLVVETFVFLFLVILFSCLMDYYFYLLYMIINIVLSILYLFSVFFIYDNKIKLLKQTLFIYKKFNTKNYKKVHGVISSYGDLVTKNHFRYRLFEVKADERETKKVFLEERFSLFKIGDEVTLYLVENFVVAYGETNEKV